MLLDGPFSRLDAALREQARATVFERAKARALPMLIVTHVTQTISGRRGEMLS